MTQPQEHRLEVARTARYYTIGDPTHPVDDLWYVCHGYSELAADFVQNFMCVADTRRLIVAPEALMRYYTDHASRKVGATWMTSEDRSTDIADYVRYLDRLHEHIMASLPNTPTRVRVLGFSQGTATVSRWVTQGAIPAGDLILWGSSLPPDLDSDHLLRLRTWALTIVFGTRDQYLDDAVVGKEQARLEQLGLEYDVMRFDGGHRMDDDTLEKLAER